MPLTGCLPVLPDMVVDRVSGPLSGPVRAKYWLKQHNST